MPNSVKFPSSCLADNVEHEGNLAQKPLSALSWPRPSQVKLVVHKLSAGFPSPAADYAEDELDLNEYLIRNKPATFLFTVKGDSMIEAGILSADKVVVDRSLIAQHRGIVVAVVGGDYTLKFFHRQAGVIQLHSANPRYPPLCFSQDDELQLWGVVVGVVRRLKSGV